MKRKIYGIAAIAICVVEFILCFVGPMAFTTKVKLMIVPFYQGIFDESEIVEVEQAFSKMMLQTGAYDIITPRMVEDYIESNGLELEKFGRFVNKDEYVRIAHELDIPRIITILVTGGTDGSVTYNTTFYNAEEKSLIKRTDFETMDLLTANYDELKTLDDKPLLDALSLSKRGYNLFDLAFFGLLAAQLAFAIWMLLGKMRPGLVEIFILPLLVMGVFAFIYALGANMDYVQRFIEEGGGLNLSANTATEQFYALVRFLPLLALNIAVYVHQGLKRRKAGVKHFAVWSLPYTLLSVCLYVISFPSGIHLEGFGILGFVAYIPLLLVFMQSSAKRSYYYGILFFVLQGILLNFWQSTYGFVSLPSVTIIFFLQAAIALILMYVIQTKLGARAWLLFPLWLVAFEFSRSWGYVGYPWGYLGVTQYFNIAFIQVADILSVLGISFLVAMVNTVAAQLILFGVKSKKNRLFAFIVLGICVINYCYGYIRIWQIDNRETTEQSLLLVQQNTDPRKHAYQDTIKAVIDLSKEAIERSDIKPDLVVWSEGAIPINLKSNIGRGFFGIYSKSIFDFVDENDVFVATGTFDSMLLDDGSKLNFNSSVLISPDGEGRDKLSSFYHKRHLVPFTEYFPYKEELPWLYAILDKFNISDWTPGENALIFEHPEFKYFTPICFEDVFSNDLRDFTKQGAQIIVNMSNDYWSLSDVEGMQHGIHALFRSVENHIPTVRATSSGMTAHIDSVGRIVDGPAPFYEASYLWADVKIAKGEQTLYGILGDWFPWLATILVLGFAVYLIGTSVYKRFYRNGNSKAK